MADTNWYPSWYVVQTRTNYESKVAKNIEQLVKYRKMQDEIFDVKIISDSQVQIKVGDNSEWKPIGDDWKKFLNLKKTDIKSVKIEAKIDDIKVDDSWIDDESEWVSRIDSYIEKLIAAVENDANSVFSLDNGKKEKSKFRKFKVIIKKSDNNDYVDEIKVEFRIVEIKKFPCYIFVCAKTVIQDIVTEENGNKRTITEPKLSDFAWQIIKDAGSAYFVGPNGTPVALSDEDIGKYGIEKVSAKVPFKVGDFVAILPPSTFAGQTGLINAVDTVTGMVKIGLFTGISVEISMQEVELA